MRKYAISEYSQEKTKSVRAPKANEVFHRTGTARKRPVCDYGFLAFEPG
jgi:hypothetical protein